MLPILIIRHVEHEGPGYLGEVLSREKIPMKVVRVDAGDDVPGDIHGISGLVLMGGPMSVNDPLEWIEDEVNLVKMAIDAGLPVLGHCLGAQIIARAMGSTVRANPVSEIGWHVTRTLNGPGRTSRLTGLGDELLLFHWHSETFDMPDDVEPVLTSKYCINQGFIYGTVLALQCHIEMTENMVSQWCDINRDNLKPSDSVQTIEMMQDKLPEKIKNLHKVADVFYSDWLKGLER